MIELSIIVPVFNSEGTLEKLIAEIEKSFLEKISYEVVLINDGSTDNSWEKLQELSKIQPNIVAINLLKNYGQHNAMMCGFHYARGEFVVTIDDDLQNPPSEIAKLLVEIKKGYDVVFGRFDKKKHNNVRKFGTKVVGYLNKKIFGKPDDLVLTNFRMMRKSVVERMINYKTQYPYVPGLVLMFSERKTNVLVSHKKREIGKSNYNFIRIAKLVSTILFNYSSFPIRFVSFVGFGISMLSFLIGIAYILRDIIVGVQVQGWTTLIVLISFLGGFIILMIGMLGEYIARMNTQLSNTKSFMIKDVEKSENI